MIYTSTYYTTSKPNKLLQDLEVTLWHLRSLHVALYFGQL